MGFFFKIITALVFTLNFAHSKQIEINVEQVMNLLYDNAILIDIRREEEWKETGIIEGSITSTLFNKNGTANLIQFLSDVKKSAKVDQPILLICRTGRRTKVATQYMLKNTKFKNVFSVSGGITEWRDKGFKMVVYR